MNRKWGIAVIWAALLTLSGCGGGGYDGGGDASSTYTVGGAITELKGDGFKIRSGTSELTLAAGASSFAFPPQANHTPYDIAIVTQPSFPIQLCKVTNGAGTVNDANVTNVAISCAAGLVVIGTIRGLTGSGLVIQNNGTGLTIAAGATGFTFPPQLDGEAYNVAVATQPSNPAQRCTVSNGIGVLHNFVSDVVITCVPTMVLTSSTPPHNAKDVSRTDPLVLTFSAALDAGSLVQSEVFLMLLGSGVPPEAVPVTLAVVGNQLTATPVSTLHGDSSYFMYASPDAVKGTQGERLTEPASISFRTRTQTAATTRLQFAAATAGGTVAQLARIAADSEGNAIAVFNDKGPNGQASSIWASRYESGNGWSTPALIESDDTGAATRPDVGFDSNGNALVVWEQSDGKCSNIFANKYTRGIGWDAPVLIETNPCDALEPRIAVSPNGNAMTAWSQSSAADGVHIWANRYVVGAGWATAERIENNAGDGRAPQVTIDRKGNALAVWEQSDGTRKNIWANRYVVGSGWGTARLIESNDVGDAQSVQITGDAVGNALAVWEQTDGTRQLIWANLYAGGEWGTAAIVGGSNRGDASHPQIAIRNGHGFVVWQQAEGARSVILARRFSDGSFSDAPGAITLLSAGFIKSASFPQIAADSKGNAVAVWNQENAFPLLHEDAAFSMTVRHFTVGQDWGTPHTIELADEGSLLDLHPQVAIGANDDAFAVWEHERLPGNSVWVSRLE